MLFVAFPRNTPATTLTAMPIKTGATVTVTAEAPAAASAVATPVDTAEEAPQESTVAPIDNEAATTASQPSYLSISFFISIAAAIAVAGFANLDATFAAGATDLTTVPTISSNEVTHYLRRSF